MQIIICNVMSLICTENALSGLNSLTKHLIRSGEVLCAAHTATLTHTLSRVASIRKAVSLRWEKWQPFSEQQMLKVLMNVIVFTSDLILDLEVKIHISS